MGYSKSIRASAELDRKINILRAHLAGRREASSKSLAASYGLDQSVVIHQFRSLGVLDNG